MQQPEISIHPLIGRLRLKKVVRSVVKDYYKELNRRKNKEISFSELPDVLVDKMAVWDDYETDYTILFSMWHLIFVSLMMNWQKLEETSRKKTQYSVDVLLLGNDRK